MSVPCWNCKYLDADPKASSLYVCTNPNCPVEYTGLCCEDECEYGEPIFTDNFLEAST